MNFDIPTINTPRLKLRAFIEDDVEPLFHILGQGDVLRYFPKPDPPPIESVQRLIAAQLKHWQERGYGWWAAVPKSQETLIGWCGLGFLPETEEDEVAYLLAKPYWGQGLATEAANTSLRYGFMEVGLEKIVGIVHPENIASQRVLEKLGLAFTKRATYFGMDCYRYEISRAFYSRQLQQSKP